MRITLLFWIICKSLIHVDRYIMRINRYIKKINIESKVVSPLQLYDHLQKKLCYRHNHLGVIPFKYITGVTKNVRKLSWMLHNVSFCSFL